MRPAHQPAVIAWLCLVGGIFSADLLLPLGYAVPMLYVLPLLLTWLLPTRGVCYWAAGGLIGLTILGALCFSGPLFAAALFNRAVASILLLSIAAGLEWARQLEGKTEAAVRQSEQAMARIGRLKQLSAWSLTLSGEPGHIFDEAVRVLGRMFDVRVVCLSEIVGDELHFKSVYLNGQVTRNAGRCPLSITPCAIVKSAKDLRVFDRVMERFPEAAFLRTHQAMAYCGTPSLDSHGEVVAVTCLLDDKPRDFTEEEQEWLRIFAQRIAMEIERARHQAEAENAETALRMSQERFDLAVRGTNDGIWDWDISTNENYWSDRWYELVGYEREALTPSYEAWMSLLHPDDLDRVLDRARRHLDERVPYDLEYRMRTKSGSYRWFHARGQAVWDASGKPLRMAGSISDITFRKQAEAALRESEERLRLVIQGTNDGIWDWNMHTGENYTSARWKEILGFSEGELPDTDASFFDLLHPDDQAKVQELLRRHLEEREPYAVEIRMRHKDGCYRWCLTRGEAVRDALGQPVRMVGSLTDIDARKQAEALLKETEERWQYAFEGSGDGVWDWNVQTGQVYFSTRWKTMLGYEPHEIGDTVSEWEARVHPDDKPSVFEAVRKHFEGEPDGYVTEHRVLCKDGSYKWILARGKVVSWEVEGKPLRMVGTHTDVTERRQAAERLRESEAFLASVLDNLPNMVFVKEAEALRFVRMNKAGEALLGYSHDELLDKNDEDFFPPKEAETFTAADRQVLAGGRLLDIPEEAIQTKHNGVRYLHTKKIPLYGTDGTPRYLLGISEDITERKQEAEARQEQERLFSLSAQLHEVLVHEESLETMLEQCAEILACHLGMALARIWLMGPGDRCDCCQKAAHCADRERCLHLEASAGLSRNLGGEYCRIPLGSLKIGRIATGAGVLWTNDAMNDDRLPNKQWMKDNGLCAFAGFPLMVSGQVMGVLAVFARAPLSDFTLRALEQAVKTVSLGVVRKRAEKQLRQSEAFIASVLDHLPSVVFVKEARELRHVRFNRACEELLGIPAQDILGKNNFDMFSADVAEKFTAKDREVLASGRLLDIPEERIDTPQGVRYLHTRKIPMFGADGEPHYLVGISEDITERKRMEEALRESHAELERRVFERTMDLAESNRALRAEIDERHRMEAQLRESEGRLKQAQALAHLGSWELDLESGRLTWSDETFRIFGIEPGEGVATYESFLACVHPDDRAAVDAAYGGSIRDGLDSYEIEHRLVVHGTGEIRAVHEKCVHIRNAAGAIVRSLGMVHDITGRRQLEAMRQAHAVMERVMQDREALMRNLHDGVLQSLYALRLGLEHSRRLLAAQPGKAQESLDVQIEDLALMIAEVRRFMVGQDPVWAQAETIRDGVAMLIDSYRGTAPVEWQLELSDRDEEMTDLSPDEMRHLLYIVREAISNVVRHASATRCRVALVSDGGRWQVTIEDDGRGFNPAASRLRGLGRGNMEARARQIGAAIEMTSAPGAGTRIVITMIRRATHVSI